MTRIKQIRLECEMQDKINGELLVVNKKFLNQETKEYVNGKKFKIHNQKNMSTKYLVNMY